MVHHPDFEQILAPLLDQANEFADHGLAFVEGLLPENVTGATLPDATVQKLHIVSTINYRSGLACLRAPETSLSAFTLLRGLLEAWSHLAFIDDNTAGGDARCRALRFERGVSTEWAYNVRAAPDGFGQAAWLTHHEENAKEIDALWHQFGCKGTNRTQSQAVQTLTTLAKQPGMDWINGVWRSTSATTHMYGVEFALVDRGNGTTELVWALPSHRASWLMWLAASYAYLTTTAANILQTNAPGAGELHHAVNSVLETSELKAAISGSYDHDP